MIDKSDRRWYSDLFEDEQQYAYQRTDHSKQGDVMNYQWHMWTPNPSVDFSNDLVGRAVSNMIDRTEGECGKKETFLKFWSQWVQEFPKGLKTVTLSSGRMWWGPCLRLWFGEPASFMDDGNHLIASVVAERHDDVMITLERIEQLQCLAEYDLLPSGRRHRSMTDEMVGRTKVWRIG